MEEIRETSIVNIAQMPQKFSNNIGQHVCSCLRAIHSYFLDTKKAAIAADILECLALVLIIVMTGSIWGRLDYLIDHPSHGWSLVWMISVAAALLRYSLKGWHTIRLTLPWMALFALLFLTDMLFGRTSSATASAVIFVPLIVFTFYAGSLDGKSGISRFMRKFIIIMLIISFISLFFFIFGSLLRLIEPSGSVSYEWDTERTNIKTFWNLYYEPQSIEFLGYKGARNCAIFAEAPMFIFLTCLALGYQLLILRQRKGTCAVLCLAVLSTFSSTGYVALLLMALFFLLDTFRRRLVRRGKSLMPLAAVSAGLLFLVVVIGTVLLTDKSTTASYDVRMDHLITCWHVFLETFPTGLGFGNLDLLVSQFSFKQGPAVGLMYFFALGGIWAVLTFSIPFAYAFIKSLRTIDLGFLGYMSVFFWLFFTTSVLGTGGFQWVFLTVICIGFYIFAGEGTNLKEYIPKHLKV